MKTSVLLVSTAIALMLTGCSFRASTPFSGKIETLSLGGVFTVNQPIHITADARFAGAVKVGSLSIRKIDTTSKLIQVSAFGQRPQPFMGLGIFPVDTQSPHAVKLISTVSVDQAGTYLVEAVLPETGVVTATASMDVSPWR
jgi:hypothetical protein